MSTNPSSAQDEPLKGLNTEITTVRRLFHYGHNSDSLAPRGANLDESSGSKSQISISVTRVSNHPSLDKRNRGGCLDRLILAANSSLT
jgi:hypothetical protein